MNDLSRIVLLAMAVLAGASCSQPKPVATAPAKPIVAAEPTRLQPPAIDDQKPSDYPGLHNVVAYVDGLYCGSLPEGEVAFESLQAMGIKTIISVDGATPNVQEAKAHGMRYVHLPIGYNGMDKTRTLEIARAVKDLPGPVYLHCHLGKHRSAGAAGAAAVTLGMLTPEQATLRMKVSGTAPNYTGLYQCVAVASIASTQELSEASNAFPETTQTSGLVKNMVEVEEVHDHLKAIEKAGWVPPANHPDLVPVAQAGRMADLYRHLLDDARVKAKPAEFQQWILEESRRAEELENELLKNPISPKDLSERFKQITQSCKDCHVKYRD